MSGYVDARPNISAHDKRGSSKKQESPSPKNLLIRNLQNGVYRHLAWKLLREKCYLHQIEYSFLFQTSEGCGVFFYRSPRSVAEALLENRRHPKARRRRDRCESTVIMRYFVTYMAACTAWIAGKYWQEINKRRREKLLIHSLLQQGGKVFCVSSPWPTVLRRE